VDEKFDFVRFNAEVLEAADRDWRTIKRRLDSNIPYKRYRNRLDNAKMIFKGIVDDDVFDIISDMLQLHYSVLEKNMLDEFGDELIGYERIYS
jgi:hypothetical protein